MIELDIPQPESGTARSLEEAVGIASKIGYPLMVRPSYVLGGRGMEIVYDEEALRKYALEAINVSPEHPMLIDRFLENAIEVEVDALSDGDETFVASVMEHIELAGVHSGDSACSIPSRTISKEHRAQIEKYTEAIAKEFSVVGLINIQFAIKDEQVYVIEANPRASRTTPFIAKAYQVPYLNIATHVMLGNKKLKDFEMIKKLEGYAIKVPVFSFNKFPNVDKNLGPEMKSTGEAIRFIDDIKDPYFRELDKKRSMYLTM